MTLKTVHLSTVDSISSLVEESVAGRAMSLLLLFDEGTEPLHDQFLLAYLRDREERHYDSVVLLRGELIDDQAAFFREVRRAVHLADYMGGSFDAVEDVLRVEALSRDHTKRTYWVWRNSHVLSRAIPGHFAEAFEVLVVSARQVSAGFSDPSGTVKPPWPDWEAQPVIMILTATWEALGREASDTHSFLYRLPLRWSPLFPDLSTGLTSVRIRKEGL